MTKDEATIKLIEMLKQCLDDVHKDNAKLKEENDRLREENEQLHDELLSERYGWSPRPKPCKIIPLKVAR